MIDSGDLSSDVLALGELLGLLKADGNNGATVQTDWFSSPVSYLDTVNTRLNSLVTIIDGVLGPAIPNGPDVFSGAQWYSVPNPSTGGSTPFSVVTPPTSATSGQLGVGVLCPLQLGTLTIEAFAYLPLFSFCSSGAHFIADNVGNPSQIGLYVTTTEPFTVGNVSFTALMIEAEIYLADKVPTITVTFENLKGTDAPSTYTNLAGLLNTDVGEWIGEVIVQGGYWLNLYIGASATTVGDVLVAANFLTLDEKGEYHLSLSQLQGTSPLDIALNFAFAGLDALANLDVPLVPLPGGGIMVAHDAQTGDYGLRFAADLSLSPNQSTSGSAPPTFDVSLGSWFTGETDAANWMSSATGSASPPAGLSVFMLRRDPTTHAMSFQPSFELVSAGINVSGGANAPLVNLKGYTLQGVETRAYLESSAWKFGFGARLDTVGFPLGPSFSDAQEGSANSNAVAQNLLATGGGSSDGGGGGGSSPPTSAVNPGFSAELAYVKGSSAPYFEILDPTGAKTDIIWFPIQRRFGPLNCQQVGLEINTSDGNANNPILGIVFDGGVTLSVLDVELDQLSLSTHLKEIASVSGYSLDLQGLSIAFNSGAVEISGGLMKHVGQDGIVSYDGEALIKFTEWAIAALGSYCSLPGGGTSMFIFGVLSAPLGGPGFFFVTGLAAGFGYNRGLKLPAQGDVSTFPLVAMMVDASAVGGNTSPATVLATLESGNWVPLQRGEYWLAAGIQFTSFEIINTNALVVIEFGQEFVISLLGTSILRQPQVGTAYVYAELDIEVIFAPQEGYFKASAVLSNSSYVLTQDAHLTGGFAAYAWFGTNPHAGDFVFTLGGYHPAFKAPDYYPMEPRVGINWQIGGGLSMVGGAYLAITPNAMMAGAAIAITYSAGNLNAWLKAQADAILFYKPFYLIADASISIGVSYRINFLFIHKTISVEIGADFHLWGPPIGGRVHVNWYIISFTIGFGADESLPTSMSWDDFKGMLPSKTTQSQSSSPRPLAAVPGPAQSRRAMASALRATTTTTSTPAYLTLNATQGILRTGTIGDLTVWLVRAEQLVLNLSSAIPASQIVVVSEKPADNVTIPGQPANMRGVSGVTPSNYSAVQTVAILALSSDSISHIDACMATTSPCTAQPAGCTDSPIDLQGWSVNAIAGQVPKALWGPSVPAGQAPNINDNPSTVVATTGVTMAPLGRTITNCTPQMVIATVFGDIPVNSNDENRLPLSQTQQPSGTPPRPADSFADIANVNGVTVATNRAGLFVALQALGVNGWTNNPLPQMAATPGRDFADEPLEGAPAPTPVPTTVS